MTNFFSSTSRKHFLGVSILVILSWAIFISASLNNSESHSLGLFSTPAEAYAASMKLETDLQQSNTVADAKLLLDNFANDWNHTYLSDLYNGLFWLNPNSFLGNSFTGGKAAYHNKKLALSYLYRTYDIIRNELEFLETGNVPNNYLEWLKLNSYKDKSSGIQSQRNFLFMFLYNYASAYNKWNDPQKSIEIYDTIEKINNAQEHKIFQVPFMIQTYLTKGWNYYKLNKLNDASSEINKVAQLLKSGGNLNKVQMLIYGNGILNLQAVVNSKKQLFNKSVKIYHAMLKLNAGYDNSHIWNNLGETYTTMFQFDKAEDSFMQVISNPGNANAPLTYFNMVALKLLNLDLDGANALLQRWENESADKNTYRDNKGIMALLKARISYWRGDLGNSFKALKLATSEAIHNRQIFDNMGFEMNSLLIAINQLKYIIWNAWSYEQKTTLYSSFWEEVLGFNQQLQAKIEAWQHIHLAFRGVVNDYTPFDDLFIFNAESMMDYSAMGDLLSLAEDRVSFGYIDRLMETDSREDANKYYNLYRAQVLIANNAYIDAATLISNNLPLFHRGSEKSMIVTSLKVLIGSFAEIDGIESSRTQKKVQRLYNICQACPRLFGFPMEIGVIKPKIASNLELDSKFVFDYLKRLLSKKNIIPKPVNRDKNNFSSMITTTIRKKDKEHLNVTFYLRHKPKFDDQAPFIEKSGECTVPEKDFKPSFRKCVENFGNIIFQTPLTVSEKEDSGLSL